MDSFSGKYPRFYTGINISVIQALRDIGVSLVTSPNFSVLLDVPRQTDLHALKRIGLVYEEFQREGVLCALHTNGRTDTDFQRWGEFLQHHEEISLLSYEFTTGAGSAERMEYHLDMLEKIRELAHRNLSIVVRGNKKCLPRLRENFDRVIFLESDSFVRSMKRREAYLSNKGVLKWRTMPTDEKECLGALLEKNIKQVCEYINRDRRL